MQRFLAFLAASSFALSTLSAAAQPAPAPPVTASPPDAASAAPATTAAPVEPTSTAPAGAASVTGTAPASPATPPGATPAPTVGATPAPAVGATPAPAVGATPPPAPPASAPAPAPAPQASQLRLDIANGTSIRFGLLWQLQYEARGNSSNSDYSQNIFLRRFALLLGGTVLHDFEYFFDTDFANLLKAPTGEQSLKNGPGIQTKDAFATWRAIGDQLKFDGGLFLPPGARQTLIGGSSINGVDFFANAYRHSAAFGTTVEPYGRDLGAEVRGLVLGDRLEYRAGVFQGKRNLPVAGPPSEPASRNGFRYAARLQVNFLDPEPGFFYGGTYLGKKKVLALGGAVDFQRKDDDPYRAISGDVFLEHPLGPGGVTADIELIYRDGGERVALPKQTAFEGELSYRIDPIKLSPIVRLERRWARQPAGNETDYGAGLSFWAFGHNANLKGFYTRLAPDDPVKAYNQFNLQWQVFFY